MSERRCLVCGTPGAVCTHNEAPPMLGPGVSLTLETETRTTRRLTMEAGNKKYAVEPGTGRRVLVEAFGDKLDTTELGYKMLSDDEIAAQRDAMNSGSGSSVLSSSTAKGKTDGTPRSDTDGDTSAEGVTWDDVTKDQISAYAEANNVDDFPKSGTKAEFITALGDGTSAADVKAHADEQA